MIKIVIYTSKSCAHCQAAKQFFDSKKMTYRLCDVGTPRGRKEHAALGARGVPVIKIGDKVLHGFSVKAVEQALK
ncbi:NrdH-redoxin [Enterovibrio norvegicus FF-33]|uniref:glutaredoxin family protein n=1 Tax=Enterovibrio norvegicus TaxID=188144 RepID=UPI0002E21CAB|nr:glutaredoxin family protein [Enterovibrio norvegicus]OEE67344.1 NrdH-redoxin [Enterovibrio norvegicus FF-33]OEE86518.1 NrdH-redoxin [Enterovibrio norvegicus FF-162]